jgi:hypothetical protein
MDKGVSQNAPALKISFGGTELATLTARNSETLWRTTAFLEIAAAGSDTLGMAANAKRMRSIAPMFQTLL